MVPLQQAPQQQAPQQLLPAAPADAETITMTVEEFNRLRTTVSASLPSCPHRLVAFWHAVGRFGVPDRNRASHAGNCIAGLTPVLQWRGIYRPGTRHKQDK
jgi:hypothetical protein